jgi:hypothetical protein
LGRAWAANHNLRAVTVRQRIDNLAAEPPVRDLGYVADQRLVAGALLGLQLLADEIDALKAGRVGAADIGTEDDHAERDIASDVDMADIVDHLSELTAQVRKLTKAIKRGTGTRGIDQPVTGKQNKKKKKSKKSERSERSERSDDSPGLE